MVEKVVKTEAQWREELTPTSFEVTRKKAPNGRSPGSIGITTSLVFTGVFAAAPHCLHPTPNSILVADGPATSPH